MVDKGNAFAFLLRFHHLYCHTFVYFENKTLSRKDKQVKVKVGKEHISYLKTYILNKYIMKLDNIIQ